MIRRPFAAVDYEELVRAYPPPPEYFETAWFASADEIEAVQLARLRQRAAAAGRVPFFEQRWEAAGFDPRSIRTLDDLWRAPAYTVEDIRKSIDAHPPWGDYQGVTPVDALREPMRVYMSGGTTGKSRPTFYTQWDREVGAVLTARALYAQGIRPGDVVLNSWAYGTHNGAFAFDEALHRWLNCVVLTTGTGNVTSSERQVELAIEYGANAILTTGDYLLRLADVAREMGYDPSTDIKLTALPNIGDRALLESTFGAECFSSYGFHEVQWVSVECPAHDGLHIFEDAFIVQIVDPETGEEVPDGEPGAICITELYKTGSPQFRYNIMDLSYLYPRERCACGSWLRRMGPFAGRGDNMVKLRGVNVWPEAVGDIALAVPGVAPDWFVRAVRVENRDELVVSVASDRDPHEFPTIAAAVEERLKERLGVRIATEVVRPGELDAWTEVNVSPKLKRFRDER
ncbi:MAG: phenylacetate--CoA ligase family protein [Acidimicrobiia bacterium]